MNHTGLTWNVYKHDFNHDEIEVTNVFDWYNIDEYMLKQKKNRTKITREEFVDGLKHELRWMFWSRSEYEVIISAWCGGKAEEKIDIFDQIMLNWDIFCDYSYAWICKGMKTKKTTSRQKGDIAR